MEEARPKSKKISCFGLILIIGLAGIFISMVIASISTPSSKKINQEPTTETEEERKQTKAAVNFTGTKFVITNQSNFDWERVEIIINEKYRYEAGVIKSGSTYEIGVAQFTDNKYNRFNPFEVKPAGIRICVKEPISDDWYGELN